MKKGILLLSIILGFGCTFLSAQMSYEYANNKTITAGSYGRIGVGEIHYSQRKDGTNPWASCTKVSIAPLLVPAGNKDYWARPQIRLVSSIAFYNAYAKEQLYSPYLQFTGPRSVGYYLGLKAEWWIMD